MSTLEKAVCQPAVFPYFAEREQWPPDTLNLIYRKLVAEDILPDLCHERGISEEDFVKFVDEARGSFAFFREFWHPAITESFGRLFLSHGFGMLSYDVIYGITPASNKLAVRFCRKLGFTYHPEIPNFCSRRGELTDAMICTMNRGEFEASLKEADFGEGRS